MVRNLILQTDNKGGWKFVKVTPNHCRTSLEHSGVWAALCVHFSDLVCFGQLYGRSDPTIAKSIGKLVQNCSWFFSMGPSNLIGAHTSPNLAPSLVLFLFRFWVLLRLSWSKENVCPPRICRGFRCHNICLCHLTSSHLLCSLSKNVWLCAFILVVCFVACLVWHSFLW